MSTAGTTRYVLSLIRRAVDDTAGQARSAGERELEGIVRRFDDVVELRMEAYTERGMDALRWTVEPKALHFGRRPVEAV